MEESLLQFIWQFQYFNKQQLQTSRGEPLLVEKPGIKNTHQGPDFTEASIRIGNTRWVGNIELHVRSSDWHKHGHSHDSHYDTVILHVVWKDDEKVTDKSGNTLTTLVLENRISRILLDKYRYMMDAGIQLPCYSFLPALTELAWISWKERLVAERLERKSKTILQQLAHANNNWEEVSWWLLASAFGNKVNTLFFEQLAKSIPHNLLSRYRNRVTLLEALLLGQANLLEGSFTDTYVTELQKEYLFLQRKYRLSPVMGKPAMLRMRPAAFPTVRLAQLAGLLARNTHFFSLIKDTKDVKDLLKELRVTTSNYWNDHYRLDKITPHKPKQLGNDMAQSLLINAAIPLLFAYGLYNRNEGCQEKSIQWLFHLQPETNQLTIQWTKRGISHTNALDSQALIELTNHYCTEKRCLQCAVGNKILCS